jgi:hypothetical protein
MTETYQETTLYCANHPGVETSLRCQKCNKPICPKCAVLTPTGYKCKECVRSQQKVFETAEWYDYVIGFVVAGFCAFLGSLLVGVLGWFSILLAPIAGGITAEIVRVALRKRRSSLLFKIVAVGAALGSLFFPLSRLLIGLAAPGINIYTGNLFTLLFQLIYAFLVTSTVYYRLRGINIR